VAPRVSAGDPAITPRPDVFCRFAPTTRLSRLRRGCSQPAFPLLGPLRDGGFD
jgi:hypothetical protein